MEGDAMTMNRKVNLQLTMYEANLLLYVLDEELCRQKVENRSYSPKTILRIGKELKEEIEYYKEGN